LSELLQHYQNLIDLKSGRESLKQSFPKTLASADFEQWKLEYKPRENENDFFEMMDALLQYSIPAMKSSLEEGSDLYRHVEKNLHITEIGLRAPSVENGYFFLCAPPKKEARIYQYNLTRVHLPDGPYRALHVSYLSQMQLNFTTTFERAKTDLIRSAGPNAGWATYLIESEVYVPWEESLLPVAKRRLVEYLAKQEIQA
jgi:hypothetical protein